MGKKLKIKEEYKGRILSNGKLPKLVVDNLEEDMYQFAIKMGFGKIFEEVIEEKPKKVKKTKKKVTPKPTEDTDDSIK